MAPRTSRITRDPAFGTLLREFRTRAGLTQEALAELAGLSVRGISDLERGLKRAPRRDTVALLLEALVLSTLSAPFMPRLLAADDIAGALVMEDLGMVGWLPHGTDGQWPIPAASC